MSANTMAEAQEKWADQLVCRRTPETEQVEPTRDSLLQTYVKSNNHKNKDWLIRLAITHASNTHPHTNYADTLCLTSVNCTSTPRQFDTTSAVVIVRIIYSRKRKAASIKDGIRKIMTANQYQRCQQKRLFPLSRLLLKIPLVHTSQLTTMVFISPIPKLISMTKWMHVPQLWFQLLTEGVGDSADRRKRGKGVKKWPKQSKVINTAL